MDVERCAQLAVEIAAAYPRHRISELTLTDWTQRLADIPGDERIPAIVKRLKNLPGGPPEPADFRQARRDNPEPRKARPALTPGELYGSLEEAAADHPELAEKWERLRPILAGGVVRSLEDES